MQLQDFIEHRLQPLKKESITVKRTEGKLDYMRRPYNDREVIQLVNKINKPTKETVYYRDRMSVLKEKYGDGLELEGMDTKPDTLGYVATAARKSRRNSILEPMEKTVAQILHENDVEKQTEVKSYIGRASFCSGREYWIALDVSKRR